MDPFTQRMLEKAEQRSRTLGISNASKFPLSECVNAVSSEANVDAASMGPLQQKQQKHEQIKSVPCSSAQAVTFASKHTGTTNKQLQVVEKKSIDSDAAPNAGGSPNKVLRQFSAVNKENVDLGIEINIMMDKNVEVEVHVEEQDTTDGENDTAQLEDGQEKCKRNVINQPLARIRDASRSRLQRLGALYSKPDDLSSPIHRTEGKFSAEDANCSDTGAENTAKRPKQRYGKLAALADSINQWEDDTAHHSVPIGTAPNVPPPKPDLPSRRLAQQQNQHSPDLLQTNATTSMTKQTQSSILDETSAMAAGSEANTDSSTQTKTKQLKWDPKVINSLEAQGFQRRESNTAAKLAYEYVTNEERVHDEVDHQEMEGAIDKERGMASHKPVVSKLTPPDIFSSAQVEKKTPQPSDKIPPPVKQGLVSGRAAAFEYKAATALNQQQQRPQKDPTELSLKERMLLFEKNKGCALLPKAAFGMAPPINKIRQESTAKKEASKVPSAVPTSSKSLAESSVRDKVAALAASASTISENKIIAEIHKQRQEDMQILANRFNKHREAFGKGDAEQQREIKDILITAQTSSKPKVTSPGNGSLKQRSALVRPSPPPPPPPLPQVKTNSVAGTLLSAKRRSPGDIIDETKRARKTSVDGVDSTSNARLYPMLSDLESNESYTCGTTVTPVPSECNAAESENAAEKVVGGRDELKEQDDEKNCHDSYMDSEDDDEDGDGSIDLGNNSLGREVLQVVKTNDQNRNQKQQHRNTIKVKGVHYSEKDRYYGGDSSLNSSEASMGVDDYLDEALDDKNEDGDDDFTQESEEDEEEISKARRGSQGTTASNSFTFRKTPKRFSNCQTISEEGDDYETPMTSSTTFTVTQPVTSELSVNQQDDNVVTLVHTVSFYRKQQTANSNNSTPVRRICREQKVLRSTPANGNADLTFSPARNELSRNQIEENLSEDGEDSTSDGETEGVYDSHVAQEKIRKLLDEVCKQQQVIAQTSQALNLCAATIEFSGSTESVEGERHLLVATHRRQACLDEIQRLRVEKSLRPLGAPKEKGHLTVKEITVPLRQDYIRKLAADTISGHHLVCLLKYNEFVLATRTVPTLPGLLAVKFPDVLHLNNVYADFRVTVEIYGMTAQREILPHEVKYHINQNKKTPKKKGDNRLVMPPVQSPAGPNVVRTPALVQYGFAIFSLRETQRTSWTLTQVLGVSPLEGTVHMKVNCELSVSVEHKGFLTMFEDISGFGAWHRRWCHLSGTMLNFWKYPDDEKKKTPMGSIDLYTCTTQKVATAPRDICARLNTMLLECERPALETDQDSLIIVPNGRTTTVRYLLSADTKEEREEWCAYFNKALTLLRAWGPPQ